MINTINPKQRTHKIEYNKTIQMNKTVRVTLQYVRIIETLYIAISNKLGA